MTRVRCGGETGASGSTSRRLRVGVALMMCVTLSGCFTTHLWRPPSTEVVFEDGTVGRFRDEGAVEVPSRSWSDIGWRLLATPGFLALDLLTWPIQAFFADPEGFVSDRMKENRSASEAQPGQPE